MPALTPDVEAIVGAYLRAQPAITALVGARVGGRTPPSTADGWIRVTQIDDTPEPSVLHLVTVHLQLDCYGGGTQPHEQASVLARTARSVLADLPGQHPTGVVTGVRFTGARRAPDPDLTPARERFILGLSVSVHP